MPGSQELQSTQSDAERLRFLFVLSETLEKVTRLRQILYGQKAFIGTDQGDGESIGAVDNLAAFLEKHCQTFLEISDLVSAFLQRTYLNDGQIEAVLSKLAILIKGVGQTHELLLLLPREAAMPQASFLLRDCLGIENLRACIVLTNFIVAYEYRLADVLGQIQIEQNEREALTQGGDVLCQAFADKDNPLAWPMLAHEYGHVLNDDHASAQDISKEIVSGDASEPQSAQKRDSQRSWILGVISETVADFVAARVLGPASLMPILFVEMMQPPRDKLGLSTVHPPTPLRVQLVREYLASLNVSTTDFKAVFDAYDLDYDSKLQEMGEEQQKSVDEHAKTAEQILRQVVDQITLRVNALGLRRFETEGIDNARALQTKLASRQPISSRRSRSDDDIFAGLESLTAGKSTSQEAYAALEGLDEDPVPTSEILTAGWLYRLSSLEEALRKTFPGAGQKPDLRSFGDLTRKTDDLLLKSLERAAVHEVVRRRLTAA